jgi:hypothetical protein
MKYTQQLASPWLANRIAIDVAHFRCLTFNGRLAVTP